MKCIGESDIKNARPVKIWHVRQAFICIPIEAYLDIIFPHLAVCEDSLKQGIILSASRIPPGQISN